MRLLMNEIAKEYAKESSRLGYLNDVGMALSYSIFGQRCDL